MPRVVWTRELIAEEALKYATRSEFARGNSRAYHAAKRRKILDEVCKHMKPKPKAWTPEQIKAEALKYRSRTEFLTGSKSAYHAACRLGVLNDVCTHMISGLFKWTDEELHDEAKKYKRRIDFQKGRKRAYSAALARGILDNCCSHMQPRFIWDLTSIAKEAGKYKTRSEFQSNSASAYTAAKRLGVFDDVCAHMRDARKDRVKWDEKAILKLALECESLAEFSKRSKSAYNRAHKLNLIDRIKELMPETQTPLNTQTFIERAKSAHGGRYDYSLVRYKSGSEKVTIICPVHGEFSQLPGHHLRGRG